jgi:hypothetical protein
MVNDPVEALLSQIRDIIPEVAGELAEARFPHPAYDAVEAVMRSLPGDVLHSLRRWQAGNDDPARFHEISQAIQAGLTRDQLSAFDELVFRAAELRIALDCIR